MLFSICVLALLKPGLLNIPIKFISSFGLTSKTLNGSYGFNGDNYCCILQRLQAICWIMNWNLSLVFL